MAGYQSVGTVDGLEGAHGNELGKPMGGLRCRAMRGSAGVAAACAGALAIGAMVVAMRATPRALSSPKHALGLVARRQQLLEVLSNFTEFPPLCDPAIVRETCALIEDSTPEFYGTAMDANVNVLHAAEIASAVAADRHSVDDFFKFIGANNVETDKDALAKGAFAVPCQEICEKTVASFGDRLLPEVSDVACYGLPGMEKPVCDLDVSPKSLSKIKIPKNDGEFGTVNVSTLSKPPSGKLGDITDLDVQTVPKKGIKFLERIIAEMFRIHPLTGPAWTLDEITNTTGGAGESKERAGEAKNATARRLEKDMSAALENADNHGHSIEVNANGH